MTDITPAIERAAVALYAEDMNVSESPDAWPEWMDDDNAARVLYRNNAREALDAALDVDEMARVMADHHLLGTRQDLALRKSVECKCGWAPDWSVGPWIPQFDTHQAEALRAAILGGA